MQPRPATPSELSFNSMNGSPVVLQLNKLCNGLLRYMNLHDAYMVWLITSQLDRQLEL